MHRANTRTIPRLTACIAWGLLCAASANALPQNDVTEVEPERAPDLVERRGGAAPVRGEITLIDSAGVIMRNVLSDDERTISPGSVTIPLHAVRAIESDRQTTAWQRFAPVAEQLWRAVVRLERGDPALAEPIFDRHFNQFRGQTNETALVVAEGLLRCRLARAANEQAVVPWLEVVRLQRAEVTTTAYDDLAPIVDSETLLCPHLPPAWPEGHQLGRLRDALHAFDAGDDVVAAALATLFRAFADLAAGEMFTTVESELPEHAGVELLADLHALREPGDAPAGTVVTRAERRASDWSEWERTWMRYHLGLALLARDDQPARDLGLVQLAHLPANHRYAQPYLAGLALDDMARALIAQGEPDHADALRRLVNERYPGHPARAAADREPAPERETRP